MKFDKELHQKVRYEGQLYVVILEETDNYYRQGENYPVVLHPVANDWIVRFTNPAVRKYLTVEKGSFEELSEFIME